MQKEAALDKMQLDGAEQFMITTRTTRHTRYSRCVTILRVCSYTEETAAACLHLSSLMQVYLYLPRSHHLTPPNFSKVKTGSNEFGHTLAHYSLHCDLIVISTFFQPSDL